MSQGDGLETTLFSAAETVGGTGKLEDEGLIARLKLRQPEFIAPVAAS